MYLSRVMLENIRGFSGPRNVDLTLTRPDGSHAGWTVIAGRNGSGKTSLLRAITLALCGPEVALKVLPDFEDWVTSGAHSAYAGAHATAAPDTDSWPDSSDGHPGDSAFTIPLELRWHREEDGLFPTAILLTRAKKGRPGWRPTQSGWFCAAYGPFRRLAGPANGRFTGSHGPLARIATLFHEDESLSEGVSWLIEQHLRSLEGKPGATALKQAALEILSDGLLPGDYQVSDIDSDGLWVFSEGERFPLKEMSDGYRTVTALVVDLLKQLSGAYGSLAFTHVQGRPVVTSPGVVLIDEIDAHLHVSWQQRIGGWLKAHFPAIQFIVTTHSPYICQAADEGGLIRLPGPRDPESPRVIDPDLYHRIVYGSGDDAVLSELFGLDSPYSRRADQLREELTDLEAKVALGRASEPEMASYQSLRRHLNSSPATRVDEATAAFPAPGEQDT